MPALQVREFPEELYEELRAYAALHHRSMAQQTVAAVDRMIHGDAGSERSKGALQRASCPSRRLCWLRSALNATRGSTSWLRRLRRNADDRRRCQRGHRHSAGYGLRGWA